jgi:hypothetical protein
VLYHTIGTQLPIRLTLRESAYRNYLLGYSPTSENKPVRNAAEQKKKAIEKSDNLAPNYLILIFWVPVLLIYCFAITPVLALCGWLQDARNSEHTEA